MTTLTPADFRLLQRSLELAAGYANTERDEAAILELSARIRRAQSTVPATPEAHAAVTATITAIKHAGRRARSHRSCSTRSPATSSEAPPPRPERPARYTGPRHPAVRAGTHSAPRGDDSFLGCVMVNVTISSAPAGCRFSSAPALTTITFGSTGVP